MRAEASISAADGWAGLGALPTIYVTFPNNCEAPISSAHARSPPLPPAALGCQRLLGRSEGEIGGDLTARVAASTPSRNRYVLGDCALPAGETLSESLSPSDSLQIPSDAF